MLTAFFSDRRLESSIASRSGPSARTGAIRSSRTINVEINFLMKYQPPSYTVYSH